MSKAQTITCLHAPSIARANSASWPKAFSKKAEATAKESDQKLEKDEPVMRLLTEAINHVSLCAAVGRHSRDHGQPSSSEMQRRRIFVMPEASRQRLEQAQSNPYDPEEQLSSGLLNPWSFLRYNEQTFRESWIRKPAAIFYESWSTDTRKAKCCITGICGDANQVVAGQIVPRTSWRFDPCWFDSDHIRKLNGIRNILIMSKGIKKAFDEQCVCFLCVEDKPGTFKLRIWDQEVLNEPIFPGSKLTIGAFQGTLFSFHEKSIPFTRFLSWHAQCSYKAAIVQKWITRETEPPEEYGSPLKNDIIFCSSLESDTEEESE